MRRPDQRGPLAWLLRRGCALFVVAQLSACSIPNSSASLGLQIAPVGSAPETAAQMELDLNVVRRLLIADGFDKMDAGPGPLAAPEHQRIEFLFGRSDGALLHGFVSRADDDTIHLLIVDNRRGERQGFGPQSCGPVLALRDSLRKEFADRLLQSAPDLQALQRAQLRACE